MNTLLIFFAFPVATVILAIVLQKVLNRPLLVAATFFAIFLVITFAFFDATFLIAAIIYTIIAYITAVLVMWICRLLKILENKNNGNCRIIERPITINNTSPCNSVTLTSDDTCGTGAFARNTTTGRNNGNCNCNCCARCGRR